MPASLQTLLKDVRSPIDHAAWPEPGTVALRIVVEGAVTDADAQRLAAYAEHFAETVVCVAHHPRGTYDLRFLQHFRQLTGFELYDYAFDQFDELAQLPPGLRALSLGSTKSSKLSLRLLTHCTRLESLHLEGQSKDIDCLASFAQLKELTLRSISLPDLELLASLPALDRLALKLGGYRDFDALRRLTRLRYLELWQVRRLERLDFLAELSALQYVFLQALGKVDRLPSCEALGALRRAHLETMKGLRDLAPLAKAPALEELLLIDMKQLDPSDVAHFRALPRLRCVTIGLGSTKKNDAASALLSLPTCGPGTAFVFR